MPIDKSKLLDENGRPFTQSLFLEIGYGESAIYTFKDHDHTHHGKTYIALKPIYLDMRDPTEYTFANDWFLGWKHWMRICDNKVLRREIDQWREELEIKLRSQAIRDMIKSAEGGNYQASKWLVDRGWHTRGAGRPSKAEVEAEKKILSAVNEEYSADVIRLRGI